MNREAPARPIWGEKAGPVVLTHLPTPDHSKRSFEMAIDNVTRPPLQDVAHAQSDALWDVIALLEAARDTPFVNQGESGDRLILMAIDKVRAIQHAFNPYI